MNAIDALPPTRFADPTTIGLWRLDRDGLTVSLNTGMRVLLELDDDQQIAARSCWAHLTSDASECVRKALSSPEGVEVLETELLGARGARRRVTLCVISLAGSSAAPTVQLVALDRQRADFELRASEERYRRLFDDDLTSILVTTSKGIILDANPEAARMLGLAGPDTLLGRNIGEFYVRPERHDQLIASVRAEGRTERSEEELRRIDGEPVSVIASVIGSFDEAKQLSSVRWYLFDITDAKRQEEQIRTSQKIDAIVRLAGGVAHGFNNLLTVIVGHTERLVDELPPDSPLQPSAHAIQDMSDRAASLTRQLLAFSRRQVFELQVVDVRRLMSEVQPLLREVLSEAVELQMDVADEPTSVKVDAAQLKHVMINLALNARDAMPKGGILTVRTRSIRVDAAHRDRKWLLPGRYVRIEVVDTGIGMDPQTAARVFEPFFTTKQFGRGSGLGLATAYGIVKQTNGYVWVDTAIGAGTTFTILLPMVSADVDEIDRQAVAPPASAETILLVEDDDNVRILIADTLRRRGYVVIDVESGERAEEVFASQSGRIDLLLTDVVLGAAMNGAELANRLKDSAPTLRVLYMSGYTGDAAPTAGMMPVSPFLQKPFSPQAVVQKVREVLDVGRPASTRPGRSRL